MMGVRKQLSLPLTGNRIQEPLMPLTNPSPILPNPHLRRWMLFVDGENFTLRAQEVAAKQGVTLRPGEFHRPDSFVWLPGIFPLQNLIPAPNASLQDFAIRAYYYTTIDPSGYQDLRRQMRGLGFSPEVFEKPNKSRKSKGVDISLA